MFLDRDGTIIVDAHFLDDPERIEILPGAAEGIKLLNKAGIPVIILTNQSGVARGYFGREVVESIHDKLCEMLAEHGARVDAIYYCPHHPEGEVEEYRSDCRCRKPGPGMAEDAAREHSIDIRKSFVVGDMASDMELARNIGSKALLVRTGEGLATEREIDNANIDAVFDTLSGAAEYIIRDMKKGV